MLNRKSCKNGRFLFVVFVLFSLLVTLSKADKKEDDHGEHDDHDHEEHDHEDHEDHEEHHLLNETNPVEEILEHYDSNGDGKLNRKEFEDFYIVLFTPSEHGHEHEEKEKEKEKEKDKHDHRRFARSLLSLEADDHEHEEDANCPDADDLFTQFDRDGNGKLNEKELGRALPFMLMMVVDGCEIHEETESKCKRPSTAESWGYGILSSIIITLISVVGLLLIPLKNKTQRRYIISTLVAFAIGALVGDSVLHLLPEIFGAHNHGGEEHAHEEEELDSDTVLYRGMVVLASILGCYCFERFLHWLLPGGHSHGMDDHAHMDHSIKPEESDSDCEEKGLKKQKGWKKIKAFGYLNLVSDGIHNFVDGLVMGFNWSVDTTNGFKTTLAIGFHEIPQEFGDFGLLVKAGFTKWQAIGLNLLTAASSIIGTLIGLGVGSSVEDATPWILSVTAGFFLYIALADMVPEIMHLKGRLHVLLDFLGISLGFVVMFLLGKYAEFEGDC